jgi:tetratricopeptide (TPR) repeat protein
MKEERKYFITQLGKKKYSKMLQNYDLDRQTILEEESKRVDETTKKTLRFFDKFNITNENIRYRFINNKLKLDYSKVSNILSEEVDFDKILLFISINHPDFYPDYVSFDDFSRIYQIKKKTLDFWVDEIVESNLFKLKYFRLEVYPDMCYYFRSDDKLERILRAITEDYITKYTFLVKFGKSENMTSIINDILEEICNKVFNKNLKDQLRDFLPEYIRVLAYKIETKRKLKDAYDKLEGIIWQNISDIIQINGSNKLENQYKEKIKEIDKELESDPMNLDLHYSKIRLLVHFNQYNLSLKILDEILDMFPENEKDIKIKKASVLKKMKRVENGLMIINDLIQKYPEDHDLLSYKAYWLQYLDRKEEAINIIQKLIENEPDKGIYHDTCGEILMYFEEYEAAANKFLKAMVLGSHDWYIYQTYIKLGICYILLGNLELGVENIKEGKDLVNRSIKDPDTKKKWCSIADLFLLDDVSKEINI